MWQRPFRCDIWLFPQVLCCSMLQRVAACYIFEIQMWCSYPCCAHGRGPKNTTFDHSHQSLVTVCCSVLQCVAECCSVLSWVNGMWQRPSRYNIWLFLHVVYCTVLHCAAVCCSVVQCIAVYCSVLVWVNCICQLPLRCDIWMFP